MKTKTKTSEEQTTYSLKLVSEHELLKKENVRLQSERDILEKHYFSSARPAKRHLRTDNIIFKGLLS